MREGLSPEHKLKRTPADPANARAPRDDVVPCGAHYDAWRLRAVKGRGEDQILAARPPAKKARNASLISFRRRVSGEETRCIRMLTADSEGIQDPPGRGPLRTILFGRNSSLFTSSAVAALHHTSCVAPRRHSATSTMGIELSGLRFLAAEDPARGGIARIKLI